MPQTKRAASQPKGPRVMRISRNPSIPLPRRGAASAQWVVYDPTHFSQNVLTAARAMQQINNQIQNFDSCQK